MTGIKVGDRVRFKPNGAEVTVVDISPNGLFFLYKKNSKNWIDIDDVEPVRTKLIPFQASKWTPEMQVVTDSGSPVRILCVNAGCWGHPVLGLVNNEKVQHWTGDGKERNEARGPFGNLWFAVEAKTKTLYGYWNQTKGSSTVYEFESERDEVVEYHEKENIFTLIKFQTEIEL